MDCGCGRMRTLYSGESAADADQQVRAAAREAVWARLRGVARPDSRFHWDFSSFIADFAGSEYCVDRVRALPAWSGSLWLFITPDNSTELVRRAALADGKTFLMSTYGIRRGFVALDPGDVPAAERSYAATLDGIDRFAQPVDLAGIRRGGRIGLLITGASAVNRGGHRIGKGHGYFDLEWALLSETGVTDESSEIAAVVHDCQLVDTHTTAAAHDVPVDWIITPTRTLRVDAGLRAPGRVDWHLLRGTELEGVPPVMELAALQGRAASPGERAAAARQASSGHGGSHHLPAPVAACSPAAQSGPRPGRSAWRGDSRYGQQRPGHDRGGSNEHDRLP